LAGLDEESVRTWNRERAYLRTEMLEIRRWTAATRTFGALALRAAQARKQASAWSAPCSIEETGS
jgi:hypothetical protein